MKYPGYDETWDYLSKFADENAIPILEKSLNCSSNKDNKKNIQNAIKVIEGEGSYVDKYEIKRKKEAELAEKASRLQLPLDIPPIRETVIIDGKEMSLDEAFPILEEKIYSGDKKTLINTIDKLSEYGNMLKDRPIVTKLIDIYDKESDQDLRISIIVTLSVCGDQRAATFFDKLNESDDAKTQDILYAVKILLLKSY
jgi:HEAT repeat protein